MNSTMVMGAIALFHWPLWPLAGMFAGRIAAMRGPAIVARTERLLLALGVIALLGFVGSIVLANSIGENAFFALWGIALAFGFFAAGFLAVAIRGIFWRVCCGFVLSAAVLFGGLYLALMHGCMTAGECL